MTFRIGFKLMELDELLDDPKEQEINYAHLLDGMYFLSEGAFWIEVDGEIYPSFHPDWIAGHPEYHCLHGSRHAIVQFMSDLGKASQYINDPVPQEVIDIIRSDTWKPWTKSIDNLMEFSELKEEFYHHSQDVDLIRDWWHRRSVDVEYSIGQPIEIMFWTVEENYICISWRVSYEIEDGVNLLRHGYWERTIKKTELIGEIQKFRSELAALLYARIEDVKRRGLENDLVGTGGSEYFGGNHILNDLERRLNMFDKAMGGPYDRSTDWPATLAAIRRLEPLIGPLF